MKKNRLTPFLMSRLAYHVANFYSTTIDGIRSASLYPNLIIARCALATELDDHGHTVQEIATYLNKSMVAVRAMIEKYEERRVVANLEAFPGYDPEMDLVAAGSMESAWVCVGSAAATVSPEEPAAPDELPDEPDQEPEGEKPRDPFWGETAIGRVLATAHLAGPVEDPVPVTPYICTTGAIVEGAELATSYIPNIPLSQESPVPPQTGECPAGSAAVRGESYTVKASELLTISFPRPFSTRVQRDDFMEDMTAAFWALEGAPGHAEVSKVRRLIWKHLGLPEVPS